MQALILLALCASSLAYRIERSTDFIVGGRDVDYPGQYPWQVSYQQFGSHFCGGALISDTWTVTAAHCYVNTQPYMLSTVVGAHNLKSQDAGFKSYKMASIYVNPKVNFNKLFFTGDIALVKLAKPVEMNDFVKTIEMAKEGDDFTGQSCVLTGWGRNNQLTNDLPVVLKQMETTQISRKECEDGFKKAGGIYADWKIVDSHICFFNPSATACHGDSGGPAVCKKDGQWTLVGVTSGGSPYCSYGLPNIYTRISAWRGFVQKHSGL